MIRKLSAVLLIGLAGGAPLVGCGSSNPSTTGGSTSSTQPASHSTATTPEHVPSTANPANPSSTSTPPGAGSAAVRRAVAICKSVLQRARTLSADARSKVEGICNKAASGDVAGAKKAARQVCAQVINAIPTLAGASKEQALAACNGL